MAAAGPAYVVGKNVAVLFLDGGQISRTANGCSAVSKGDRRQAANTWTKRHAGKAELLRFVDVVIQIVAMGVQVIEAETEFIDQVVAKGVDFARGEAAGRTVAVAILEAAAVQRIVEGRR